jgi:glycosyltransferase involved in cell wall biosynthesis
MTGNLPKISCLTVTLDRIVLLKQAIFCFLNQTYPNKEMVIVTAGGNRYRTAIADYLKSLDRPDIRLEFLDESKGNLGNLRNASIEAAAGEVICQWDDDDLYHPERLARQFAGMTAERAQASFLTDHLQFFLRTRELYWVDWTGGGQIQGKERQMPASLMMYKDDRFRYIDRLGGGEDCEFRDMFYGEIPVANLSGSGYLFMYRYHGINVLSQDHHRHISKFSHDAAFIREHRELLFWALSGYVLPRPFSVKDRDGAALFQIK